MPKVPAFTLSFVKNTAEITPLNWLECAGSDNPFLSYEFFMALENSNCLSEENGWLTCHGIVKNQREETVGILPGFIKQHSMGEYIFDQNWAQAYEAAGGHYYPKYLSAIPFTPVSTKKLLVSKNLKPKEANLVLKQLINAPRTLVNRLGLSSFHGNFLQENEAKIFEDNGYLIRNDAQYHWHNNGYKSFEEFLDSLTSRKRKTIKRERHVALSGGDEPLTIDIVTGSKISEIHWDHFYQFYISTSINKWGRPYLNREFFSIIGETMAEKIVLIFAKRNENIIAGALNFLGKDTLYGRNWGSSEHHPLLHFEVCYYQAIDFAIKHGLKTVEAGAQGEHKIARGYVPAKTYSAHYFNSPVFHEAVGKYLKDEKHAIEHYIKNAATHAPFKKK
jgi:hypothetical protein